MSLSAVCVRIGGLRLNFIRRVSAKLARAALAFVSFAWASFAPDVVCVQAAADFVEFYKKVDNAKFRKITRKTGI